MDPHRSTLPFSLVNSGCDEITLSKSSTCCDKLQTSSGRLWFCLVHAIHNGEDHFCSVEVQLSMMTNKRIDGCAVPPMSTSGAVAEAAAEAVAEAVAEVG